MESGKPKSCKKWFSKIYVSNIFEAVSVVQLPHVVDELGRFAESLLGNEPARTLGQEGVGEDEDDVEEDVDQGEGVPVA